MPGDSTQPVSGSKRYFLFAPLMLALVCCSAGNGERTRPRWSADSDWAAGEFRLPADPRTRCSRRSARSCHIGANAPQGLRLDATNSYAMLVSVASSEVPSLLRVNPGNADSELPGAENPGQCRGGRTHARFRARRLSPRRSHRSHPQLDRGRRTTECGARRSAGRGQQYSRGLGAGQRGSRQAHHHLQRRPRQFAREQPTRSRCAMQTISPSRWLACVFRPEDRTWSRSRCRSPSRPAAINSRFTETDPHRSPTNPVTCSTAMPTASPVATCSFRSMSNPSQAKERSDDAPE